MQPARSSANFTAGHGASLSLALNGEAAPEWVQLLPPGPDLKGRDGRAWRMSDVSAVIAASSVPFAIDYEHATDLRAVNGEEAPAAGWVEELQARADGVWGRVGWTPRAGAAIAAREYRFLSPAIHYDRDLNVRRIIGAGLVNRPNFQMAALNHEEHMTAAIARALGVAETATEAELVTAIARLKETSTALNAQTLALYVPRADYDLALNRAGIAETALKSRDAADHKAKVEAAIDGAIKAGKVAPASKDYHLAVCATKEGLTQFEAFVAAAPSAFTVTDLGRTGAEGGGTALNAEAEAVAKQLGLHSPEARKAYAEGLAKR